MPAWRNFSIWRGKLPHWRADGVTYFVTFRHRRPLSEDERQALFLQLLRANGRKWNLSLLCVLSEKTDLLVTVGESPGGEPYELSDVVEKAKTKAGKAIIRASGERYPPFYGESYDRIVRDDEEFEKFWLEIVDGPERHEGADVDEYEFLWADGAP
ncbi:MAG: hypothetical protein KIT11_01730 [Fimbriimonadaceae bacterium]|nr:hypothetical protein [Fimbriimonadaceae bacterium]QYK54909.1 MAG: hypothetical protein KF733_07805 [Fimbriimonadaceae bacterium]